MAAGYDGSIRIDTKINSSGMNSGLKSVNSGLNTVKASLLGLASAVGLAFGVAALVNFGKASVDAATSLTNAMTGLKSIMDGQGRSFAEAQKFINSYISDGLVPATNAITAYKNLASRGYTDPQIQQTLLALKDSAAFGRQASLSLGDAVQTATEGLKNENSVLVDNAGVTKNVAAMWKDYATSIGTTADKLTKQQKIQAETAGIMQETKFQTGDAAKVASTYSGEVLKLGFNFNNLKIAIGNALISMAQAVLPSLNSIISALTRVFTLFSQVAAQIFGKQVTQTNAVASATDSAVKSQNALTDAAKDTAAATKKETKATTDAVASFDDLNVLSQDSAAGAADATDAAAGAGLGADTGMTIGAGTTLSPDVQSAFDTISGFLSALQKDIQPTIDALSGLWAELKIIGGFAWGGLKDFYNDFLVPVGKWVFGKGIPDMVNALKDGLAKINWANINKSLDGLWKALAPFAINVGSGLVWFFDNVLVPLGTWVGNNVVPLFLYSLSAAIGIINGVIVDLEPLALWLWDSFLEPLAQWTGGVIVTALGDIVEALQGFSSWVSQNGEAVRGIIEGIGVAFVTWKTIQVMSDLNGLVGSVGIAATSFSDFGLALKLIAEDRFPKLAGALTGGVKGIKDLATGTWDTITAAGEFIKTLALQAAGLIADAARWVAHTAVIVAHAVAQWAATTAVAAWNVICDAATAVAFLTSPIGLVILAIAAVIAIVVLLVTHWDTVKAAAAACWAWIVSVWNVAAGWFKTNVVQPIGKFFADMWTAISGAAKTAWDGISGVWKTVSTWFSDHVLTPIEGAFKTSINFLISLVEGFINNFIAGINVVIGALDQLHFGFPDDFPIKQFAGVSFGIDIPTINQMKLPRLKQGAVLPPNHPFPAIVGDQTSGTNIEAPLSTITQAVTDALGDQKISIEFTGTGADIARILNPQIKRENNRVGTQLVTGGGRY